jgi:hypothetical protein
MPASFLARLMRRRRAVRLALVRMVFGEGEKLLELGDVHSVDIALPRVAHLGENAFGVRHAGEVGPVVDGSTGNVARALPSGLV